MNTQMSTVLVVGATGSIGRLAVAEALAAGFETRALVRDEAQSERLPEGTRIVVGNLTSAESMRAAVAGVTGIVFTHGNYGSDDRSLELVDYGAVRNALRGLADPARIALMTTIGVTKHTPGHDWKRRGERLVRASGLPYTIVRPGWFDYNASNQHRLVMLQGDSRWASDPSDGVVSRAQIAQVLVASLTSDAANRKSLELIAEPGPGQADLEPLFADLRPDTTDALDGVLDRDNMPLADEPAQVIAELGAVCGRF